MRRLVVIIACLAMLLFAASLPAFAGDRDLLGSGASAPESGGHAAASVEVAAATTTHEAGGDVLASTGLDSAVILLVGLGLMTAGGAAVLASRARARR